MTDAVIVTVAVDRFTTADVVCRHLGRYVPGVVEAAFAATPGLAAAGILLPAGTVVTVPQPTAAEVAEAVDIVRLGD